MSLGPVYRRSEPPHDDIELRKARLRAREFQAGARWFSFGLRVALGVASFAIAVALACGHRFIGL